MPRLLPLVAFMLLPAAVPAADADLAKLFRTYLDEECARHPAYATAQGNHDHDDRLDDLSPEARRKAFAATVAWADRLAKFDTSTLTPAGKIDYRIWNRNLDAQIELNKLGLDPFEYDPREFGLYISDCVFTLLTQSTLPKARNIENAAKRIAAIPKVVAAAMDKTDKKLLARCPKVLTEIAIKRNQGAIGFYEKEIFTLTGETPGVSPLSKPCAVA